jgi:hypothetical protein
VPKKLKEGKIKFNDPRIEEAEKRILTITAAAKRGEFEPQREGRPNRGIWKPQAPRPRPWPRLKEELEDCAFLASRH